MKTVSCTQRATIWNLCLLIMQMKLLMDEALTFENALAFLRRRQKVLNGFESKIFPTRNRHKEKDIF